MNGIVTNVYPLENSTGIQSDCIPVLQNCEAGLTNRNSVIFDSASSFGMVLKAHLKIRHSLNTNGWYITQAASHHSFTILCTYRNSAAAGNAGTPAALHGGTLVAQIHYIALSMFILLGIKRQLPPKPSNLKVWVEMSCLVPIIYLSLGKVS